MIQLTRVTPPLVLLAGLLAPAGGSASASPTVAAPQAGRAVAQVDTTYGCIVCHADKRRAFRQGTHSERGIRCHDCHGGDPRGLERAAAHRGGFIGAPDKRETVRVCADCHSSPDRMRQYGLPVGQLAEFRTSRHGELLLGRGDDAAPTCTDCHDAHTILPPNDARSNVYPTNIPVTCGRCHRDTTLMARYGIPTDQVTLHRESAHGVALYENANFAAPTCVDCHGSHAALPPAVTEISNVCGRCHVLVRRAFDQGPHGSVARRGEFPGCTACHSNHGTEGIPPDRISDVCGQCHAPGSRPEALGLEINQRVTLARDDLDRAREAIARLIGAGRQVADVRFRYQAALTAYEQMAQAQHSLDLERLDDLERRVVTVSLDIRRSAEVAAEQRWEYKLLLIPIWFLIAAATLLAWFKLRGLRE